MKTLINLLQLNFLPRSADAGLLLLRLWIGLSMMLLHGWDKLAGFKEYSGKMMNFMGLGSTASLALVVFAEFFCSILLVLGLFTRFAAIALGITMGVAFSIAHNGVLKGSGSGEMAFIYLSSYIVLFVAGAGRFSLDAKVGGKKG